MTLTNEQLDQILDDCLDLAATKIAKLKIQRNNLREACEGLLKEHQAMNEILISHGRGASDQWPAPSALAKAAIAQAKD